jgi:hypothetical protein
VAALQANVQLARVCCQPSDARRPLSIFADVVPDLQRLPGALGCAPRSLALLRRLTEYDVRADGPSEDAREAEYLFASIRRSLFDLVDAVQEDQCLVLVVEDAHWLDAESWAVLREMIPWAARRRLLFVLTSRLPQAGEGAEEETPKFLVKHRVGPIDADAAVTLVELMVRERERVPDAAFRDWAVAVAEGNPFFLRELTTYWLQTGAAYEVPASLQALIDDRLDRLSPQSLQLLQGICVLAAHASLERLERLFEYPYNTLVAAANELEAAGMISVTGDAIRPRHHLLAASALQRLQSVALRLLHRRAAALLEAEPCDLPSQAIWDCAAHWEAAGEPDRSITMPLRVARHLVEIGLPGQSIEVLERLLGTIKSSPARAEVLAALGRAQCLAGHWHGAIASLLEARSLRVHAPNAQVEGQEALMLLEAEMQTGADLSLLLDRACALALSSERGTALSLSAGFHALALADACGAFDRMQVVYEQLCTLSCRTEEERAALEHVEVVFHSTCGQPLRALASAISLVRRNDERGAPFTIRARSRYALAQALYRAGRQEDGLAAADACAAFAHEHKVTHLAAMAHLAVAGWLMNSCDYTRAAAAVDRARSSLGENLRGAWAQEIAFASARLALATGDLSGAARILASFADQLPSDPIVRRRLNVQAAHLELMLLTGKNPSLGAVWASFREAHLVCVQHGNVDYATSIFVRVLRSIGRDAEAAHLLEQYTSRLRREGGSPPALITALC